MNSAKCKNTNLRLIGVIASEWVLNKFWSNLKWEKRLKIWGEESWRDARRRERHARKWERGTLAKTRKREKLKNVGSSLSHSSNFALALSWVEIAQNIRPRGDIKTFIIRPLQGIFVIRPKHEICTICRGQKNMYVYEICLRLQKQIVISSLAFSSLRVNSQVVWWQNNITEFSTSNHTGEIHD